MIKAIKSSSLFKSKFNQLSKKNRLLVVEELKLFQEDPSNSSLNTHPLKEKLTGLYSFMVLPDLLVMFRFNKVDKSEVILLDIGPHEIYK